MIVVVDVETDGPIPGDYSMIWFGAVILTPELDKTFEGKLKPISDHYLPEALKVSGLRREETLRFEDPETVMKEFSKWLVSNAKPNERIRFFADNNGFDWGFVNWYMHHFTGGNPFGFSSERINNLWHGMQKDMTKSFKHLRETNHDHNPVNDAIGNAEALLKMQKMGLKLPN